MNILLKGLSHVQLGIALLSLVAVIIINFIELTLRYLLNSSLLWIQDISLLLMVWMIFAGSTVIAYQKRDVTITLLTDVIPTRILRNLNLIKNICVFIFFTVLAYYSITLMMKQQGQTTVTAMIPLQLYTVALVLNSISVCLIYFNEVKEGLTKRKEEN